MVKQDPSDRISRNTRNCPKRPSSRVHQRNPHLASRGRPRKERSGTSPYEIQKQFTQEFIEFGKQYLEWKLNDNYVWSNDFDKKDPQIFDKLPIEDPEHREAISNVISNMCNMMQVEIGREFRQCCIEAYQLYKTGASLQSSQQTLKQKVLNDQKYSYLSLRNDLIKAQRRVIKPQIIPKFVETIVELIYKIAEKETQGGDQ